MLFNFTLNSNDNYLICYFNYKIFKKKKKKKDIYWKVVNYKICIHLLSVVKKNINNGIMELIHENV